MYAKRETGRQHKNCVLARNRIKQWYLALQFLFRASWNSLKNCIKVLVGRNTCFLLRASWNSLKNCIKVLVGRNTCFNEDGLFLRQYVLHLIGLRPLRKITSRGYPGEGAGSQALTIMDAIIFARQFGLNYVHTPFTLIEHAERPMGEWVAAWEALFNLGVGEITCGTERHKVVDFQRNFYNGLQLCFDWRSHRDELAYRFKAFLPEFRRKYYLGRSPRATDEVSIAVHIRRGDASAHNHHYFTSNETILRTITSVRAILYTHKVKYRICVYSQGNRSDFAELSLPGVEFFLNVDAVWTMQELIEADVLILAKGCFSYCAALISDGIKIFEPLDVSDSDNDFPSWRWLYLSPTDSWIPTLADGTFARAAFEHQLLRLIQVKSRTTAS
jgi:hypothetical protein